MDKRARFWDRIAERYSKKPIADESAYQKKIEIAREYFRPDWEILEIGCGTGSTAIEHAPYVEHIRATDISSRMIEIANRRAAAANVDNVSFEQQSVDDLNEPDESLDAVLALSVLHLLEDKEDVIAKIYRMLKPGGVFIASTACLGDTMKWFRFIGPIGRVLGLIPLVRVFTTDELKAVLADAGFEIDHAWQPGKRGALFTVAKK